MNSDRRQHGHRARRGDRRTRRRLAAGTARLPAEGSGRERQARRADYSHRFGTGPDAPVAELGAIRIPAQHTTTPDYIDRLGLTGELRGAAVAARSVGARTPPTSRTNAAAPPDQNSRCSSRGEHCSATPAWIEGALQSAHETVDHLCAQDTGL